MLLRTNEIRGYEEVRGIWKNSLINETSFESQVYKVIVCIFCSFRQLLSSLSFQDIVKLALNVIRVLTISDVISTVGNFLLVFI